MNDAMRIMNALSFANQKDNVYLDERKDSLKSQLQLLSYSLLT